MYRYSLSFYIDVFTRTLSEKPDGDTDTAAVSESLLQNVMQSVSIGMANKDRLTFVLHMIHGVSLTLHRSNLTYLDLKNGNTLPEKQWQLKLEILCLTGLLLTWQQNMTSSRLSSNI
jgi:hypothetical protein